MKVKWEMIRCAGCGQRTEKRRYNQRFCCGKCQIKTWMREHPRSGVAYRQAKGGE